MSYMWQIIITNDSTSAQMVEDLGISLDASQSLNFHEQFTYSEIFNSDDLRDLLENETFHLNDGTTTLSASDAINYIKVVNIRYLLENFYTKTNLQTSGESSISWDNLTDVPPLASFTIDNHLYKYESDSWVDKGISDNDRVINLDSTSQNTYTYTTESGWMDDGIPEENNAVLVDDDGDGHISLYVYDLTRLWVKVADEDMLLNGNTLDQAYDQNGSGAGRVINVDAGAVKLDASGGLFAPIELTNLTSSPTSDLAVGQLAMINGILCSYDPTRGKWLSVQRMFIAFGRPGPSRDQY